MHPVTTVTNVTIGTSTVSASIHPEIGPTMDPVVDPAIGPTMDPEIVGDGDLSRIDVAGCLRVHRAGRNDPTTLTEPGGWWRATVTPLGPASMHLGWAGARALTDVEVQAWGPGASWLLERVPQLLGLLDRPVRFEEGHPAVLAAQHDHPSVRIGGGGGLYHSLLPVIIGQRVTVREAFR